MTLARRLLWSLNGVLAAAILIFTARYLAYPPKVDRLTGVDPRWSDATPQAALPPPPNEDALRTLRNPLQPSGGPTPASRPSMTLKGALPTGESGRAAVFIKVGAMETLARLGEGILKDGRPVQEFAGWRLTDVWKDRAVFTNLLGERFEIAIDSTDESATLPIRGGEAYDPGLYRSRRLASSEGKEIWAIDELEIGWAGRHAESILDREIQLSLHAGGGLRIDRLEAGSIGTARGLQAGDVVREIDGRPLRSLADLRSILAASPRHVLQLTLERAGRTLVLEYRPTNR